MILLIVFVGVYIIYSMRMMCVCYMCVCENVLKLLITKSTFPKEYLPYRKRKVFRLIDFFIIRQRVCNKHYEM